VCLRAACADHQQQASRPHCQAEAAHGCQGSHTRCWCGRQTLFEACTHAMLFAPCMYAINPYIEDKLALRPGEGGDRRAAELCGHADCHPQRQAPGRCAPQVLQSVSRQVCWCGRLASVLVRMVCLDSAAWVVQASMENIIKCSFSSSKSTVWGLQPWTPTCRSRRPSAWPTTCCARACAASLTSSPCAGPARPALAQTCALHSAVTSYLPTIGNARQPRRCTHLSALKAHPAYRTLPSGAPCMHGRGRPTAREAPRKPRRCRGW